MTYSHMGTPTLPSALLRFTSEFGMGSGGSTTLLSLDKNRTLEDFCPVVERRLLMRSECCLLPYQDASNFNLECCINLNSYCCQTTQFSLVLYG